ncbi:MAG: hypothetical protein H0V66_14790, partial [Bdellovibrionales bacterium]|nr:hypothetical protein [Bdellovibrionales bacterium]
PTASDNYFNSSILSSYALCNMELNSRFNPAGPDLCFGKWSKHKSFFFVQDPSIIYHELGHAFVAIMMNYRNGTPNGANPDYHPMRSNLGGANYNEASSLGEGIADYFSFVMDQRTHFGDWALRKSLRGSRPMSENDPMHINGVDTSAEGRLSYPQYVLYDPNDPNVPFEDVHYAGQIISHYLVALTQSLQNQCGENHANSTTYVTMMLAETLSEMGDLKAGTYDSWGSSLSLYNINNLDKDSSFMWAHVVNAPTFRRFSQLMAKNIFKYISSPGALCDSFDQNESEKLLDDYGLLLFKNYNDDGSSTKSANVQFDAFGTPSFNPTPVLPTPINEDNRRKSVLISKQLISMALPNAATETSSYYLIDKQASISDIVKNLLFMGYPMNPSTDIAGLQYNNGNIRVSPGEIIGIIPNLYNASNSTMAGVHLLATDWDHVNITDTSGDNGNFSPCVVDDVTTVAQGAEAGASCTSTMTEYSRHVKRQVSPGVWKFRTDEAVAPVCLVQLEDGEVTRWVSQNEFRKKQGLALQDKHCLGYGGTAHTEDFTFNPHECLVRVLPGANQAFYSKIDPQKSYSETVRNGNPKHTFNTGNLLMFEVNKWIPPGTKFRCRLRAKFSNCSDCFSDPLSTNDDYIDAEYNGAKPFQVINLEFDVND